MLFLVRRVCSLILILYNNVSLGPSGCGKSSLLDILADRKDKNGLSGQILVAGKPRSKFYKYKIGYVVQEGQIMNKVFAIFFLLFFYLSRYY